MGMSLGVSDTSKSVWTRPSNTKWGPIEKSQWIEISGLSKLAIDLVWVTDFSSPCPGRDDDG